MYQRPNTPASSTNKDASAAARSLTVKLMCSAELSTSSAPAGSDVRRTAKATPTDDAFSYLRWRQASCRSDSRPDGMAGIRLSFPGPIDPYHIVSHGARLMFRL